MIDKTKTTLVLGGSGRIGRELLKLMSKAGYTVVVPTHKEFDLLDSSCNLFNKLNFIRPDYIINLAAVTTTIKLNRDYPASIYVDTLRMNINLLDACNSLLAYRPEKIINVISSCAYGQADILQEDNFLKGNIHESVRPHGEAKKGVYLASQFYRQEEDLPVTCVCFNNVCGNERWNDPDSLKVLSSLVKRVIDARNEAKPTVAVWGTGDPKREFIHAAEAAEGLLEVFENYDGDLINIGSGIDISIRDLSLYIAKSVGYKGMILFDVLKGDGQMQKLLDVSRMHSFLNVFKFASVDIIVDMVASEYEQYLKDNKL